jgi:hypothetical protein
VEESISEKGGTTVALISRAIDQTIVNQRVNDGYVNATELCKAAGKLFADYRRNAPTQEFLQVLSLNMGKPIIELVQSRKGKYGGTWVHPKVAVHFGQWLSADFAVHVANWVFEWMATSRTPTAQPQPRVGQYLARMVANRARVPRGHFTGLELVADQVVGVMESAGCPLPDDHCPDISWGRTWCDHLRSIGYDVDSLPTYPHYYPGRRTFPAKAYPDALLPEARAWTYEVYLAKYAPAYFKRKGNFEALERCDKLRLGPVATSQVAA